jgi:nucleoside-diphosphate-sugar epimerase
VYNIAGGSRTTVLEVIALLGRLLGMRVELRHEEVARGDARDTGGDIAKAQRDLLYAPEFELEAGLAAQVDAVRASMVTPPAAA